MTQAFAPSVAPSPYNELLAGPGLSGSDASRHIQQQLLAMQRAPSSQEGALQNSQTSSTMAERLFDSRAQFKILTAQIAMHIDPVWRRKLFKQLDSLLDAEEWPKDDLPPTLGSYMTLLRLLLMIKPTVKPGFGASHDGHIIAAWSNGRNLLTIDCSPRDQIQWSLVRQFKPNEPVERAAGKNKLGRLGAILAPYGPNVWFGNDEAPVAG